MSGGRATRLCVWGLIAATLVAYSNSFEGDFFLDDYGCIVGNETIGQLWLAGEDVPHGLQRRQLGRLTLWMNYQLGGLDPIGYHVVNLLIHLTAGLLLFDLARRVLQLPGVPAELRANSAPVAFAIALLWMVHPLQTESVTYVVQRLESLVSLFYLGCLYGLVRGSVEKRTAWYLFAVGSFWLGVATKEIIATAPLVLLLFDRAYLGASWRETWQKRWGLYASLAPVVPWMAYVLFGGAESQEGVSAGFALEGTTAGQYLMTQAGVVWHYLRLAVFPVGQCLDYDWPVVSRFQDAALPGLGILGLLAISCWAWLRSRRLAALGLSFFLVLAPTSSLVPIKDPAFEHRMYLPLAAIVALAVVGCWYALQRWITWRLAPGVLLASSAVLLIGLTFARNQLYCDPVAMWQDALRSNPQNARAQCNLGSAYCRQWEFALGEPHLRRAVELDPLEPSYRFRLEKSEQLQRMLQAGNQGSEAAPTGV